MSRGFWIGALLLAVACGGSDQEAVFGPVGGNHQGGAQSVAGEAGTAAVVPSTGGSESEQAGQPNGGEPDVGGTSASGGTGGAVGGQPQTAGQGGSVNSGGAGGGSSGGATAGSGAGGVAGTAGKGGAASAGASGSGSSGQPMVCIEGSLDCTAAVGCETYYAEHDHCGACEIKCALSQKCVAMGSAGHLTAYCISK